MNIVNPLEPELNVSFNVNQHAVERLKARCEQAAERLELVMRGQAGEQEGLFWLLENKHPVQQKVKVPNLLEIGDLVRKDSSTSARPTAEENLKSIINAGDSDGDSAGDIYEEKDNSYDLSPLVASTRTPNITVQSLFADGGGGKKTSLKIEHRLNKADQDEERLSNLKQKYLRTPTDVKQMESKQMEREKAQRLKSAKNNRSNHKNSFRHKL